METEEISIQERVAVSNSPYAGRLSGFWENWQKITCNKTILGWVNGLVITFRNIPQDVPPLVQVPAAQFSHYKSCINNLINIGAVSISEHEEGEFLSPYFLRLKPDKSYRFILNLKDLNNHIGAPHFKMEDYRTVLK